MDRSRLEAFSDGVFAGAITLLALNISVAGPTAHISLAHQLGSRWPAFLAYLISFLTIGIIWVNHHVLVRQITTVDRTLLFVNLVLLLFVVLRPALNLDDALKARICDSIRRNLSPRFIPDAIFQAPEVPRTLSGKKQEVPLKKLFLGQPQEKVINRAVMANPSSIDWYLKHIATHGFR